MSIQTSEKENKMGTMPVNKLLISMALPMIISMIVQALYNVVDSIFVSRLSEQALTAVSLAFPIQNLLIAVGSGVGVGVNAVLSRSLGEKNQQRADDSARQGILLTLIAYVLFLLFAIFGAHAFMASQTDYEEIVSGGTIYLQICCGLSFGVFGQMIFERLLQSTGRTFYTMITQGIGAVLNIIFDPILIFGIFGWKGMGVAGAAAATVFGQIVACALAVFFNLKKNKEINLTDGTFRPQAELMQKIMVVAIPSIIMIAIGSVMTFGMNKILIAFFGATGTTAVAVFGVYYKLQSFVFMPVFGLNNGMVPIVAYNYGAQRKDRIVQTMKLSIVYAVSIMLIGLVIIQVFPKQLLGMFAASAEMLTIGVPALRIISISFVFAGFCIISSSVYQALGNGMYSMFISIGRQLVVLLPAAYLLAKFAGPHAVWWSFPIAEIASVVLCILFMLQINKKIFSKM